MSPQTWHQDMSEEELESLLQKYYVPLAIPERFKGSLFAELERKYRQLCTDRARKVGLKSIFAVHPIRAIAVSASLIVVVGLLGVFLFSAPKDVLAETARVLRTVHTFHYEVRELGGPSEVVREIWTRGSRIYGRVREDQKVVGEMWLDPVRTVTYDPAGDRVVVADTSPKLFLALRGLDLIREFRPEDWQALPQNRVKEDGRTYQVFQMPGTGTFTGLGRQGETRMKLWIDEATCLPCRLEGELKPYGAEEWEPLMRTELLWDDVQVSDEFFEPKYPSTAKVTEMPRKPPAAALEPPAKPIVTVSREGKPGLTLENLWIHPAGLVVLRLYLHDRVPFGVPPRLADPDENPWGLKPDEIPLAIQGQLIFDEAVETRLLGKGGVVGRLVGYMLYEFEPDADGAVPDQLTFRYLLARHRRPSEGRQAYIDAVLSDPGSWQLYQFSVDTHEYVTDRIPEEVHDSSNLRPEKTLLPALKRIVSAYEAEGRTEKALEFIRAQGPRTQELLREELSRLEEK